MRPVFEYRRSDGVSVSGGYVYRGARFPFLTGIYLFGDYGSGQTWETAKLVDMNLPVVVFGEDEAGEQYMVVHNGRKLRLAADRLRLPTTLSGVTVRVNGEPAPLFAVANSGVGGVYFRWANGGGERFWHARGTD